MAGVHVVGFLDAIGDILKRQSKHNFVLLWNNRKAVKVETREVSYEVDPSFRQLLKDSERNRRNDEHDLADCINLLTQPEILNKSNAW